MDFWDTVLGHRLAETLVHTLPELTEKPKQFMVKCDGNEVEATIEEQWKLRHRLVQAIALKNEILLIFEE